MSIKAFDRTRGRTVFEVGYLLAACRSTFTLGGQPQNRNQRNQTLFRITHGKGQSRMRTFAILIGLCIVSVAIVEAAETLKGIDAVAEKHRAAVAKADLARSNAVQKSREETIGLLVKFANDAYAKKDRLSETNAWKSVLQLDRNHVRARQYFKDLGTLDATLAALPKSDVHASPLSPFVGTWRMYKDGQGTRPFGHFKILSDSTIAQVAGENKFLWREKLEPVPDTNEFYYNSGNNFQRCIIAGDRLVIEQWIGLPSPSKSIPNAPINWIVYGSRESN